MNSWMSKSIRSRHLLAAAIVCALSTCHATWGDEAQSSNSSVALFESKVRPILVEHCYDCHGNGESEGNFTLDHFGSPKEALTDADLWWRVMKNLRAGVMPPIDSSSLGGDELKTINQWIKFGPFGIDPTRIDPGPVVVRRLNRAEYGSTIRSLMGIRFEEKLLFPPDDSGHGFDNVADALTISPLLLDKYLHAAEAVVGQAVPKVTWIVPRQQFDGAEFRSIDDDDSDKSGRWLDGRKPATVEHSFQLEQSGTYRVEIRVKQHGSFEFDPGRYSVTCSLDGQERFRKEFGWDENKLSVFDLQEDWDTGEHRIKFSLEPVKTEQADDETILEEDRNTSVSFQIDSVSVEGPIGTDRRVHPPRYDRFFTRPSPPSDPKQQREYAEEVIRRFAMRALRGNVDPETIDRLVAIAESAYTQPDVSFEDGVSRAMVATLVSPKFLFRLDRTIAQDEQQANSESGFALIDELSLASRLSYFIWSAIPDDELFEVATEGRLRSDLKAQVDRMLADPKADAFVTNFVGQWLRTRDVAKASVDPAAVLGFSQELEELRDWFRSRFRRGRRGRDEMSDEGKAKVERYREIRRVLDRFDDDLKRSMRRETEMLVEHIVNNDLSMLDLIDCNYTFLNEKLAQHYGVPGVEGREMRLVELPSDSPRGGVLTHASILTVTSNPTRTSPVKRGLFVLENLLGTPAPPAPGLVPELEESADRFEDHQPTLRELLEVHRENDLCSSCHARMDPLGLALENFDALGMWREQDGDAEIDPQGKLVTGETFDNIHSLKKILRQHHANDFYRCVTEKMLVYAIGRGLEYTDEHTIDQIVEQLDNSGGRFRTLVQAVIESAPFQQQRISVPNTHH